jgi:hypothetical protein
MVHVRARSMSTCPNAWNSVSDNMTLNRGADEQSVFGSAFAWPAGPAQGLPNFTIEIVLEHPFVFNISAGHPLTVHVVVPPQNYREDPTLQDCSAHAFDALSVGAKSSLVTTTVDGSVNVSADFAVVAELTYDEMPTAAPTPVPSTTPSAVPTSTPTAQPTAPPTAVPTVRRRQQLGRE